MNRTGSYLVTASGWLRAMQLVTGELPAFCAIGRGDPYLAPLPLLSTIAYDALAYVDPRSPRFVGRVRDLVPPELFRTIVSIRWGLRLSIAAEESADGTWRLHGRGGAGEPDVATSACGAAVLLPNIERRRVHPIRRHVDALRRLAGQTEWSTFEAAHVLRFLTLAGADTQTLAERVRRAAQSESMSIAGLHAVVRALRDAALLIPALQLPDRCDGRLGEALRVATLLDAQRDAGDALGQTLFDTTPPWLWPADAYDDRGVASPAVALALRISNVARLTAMPRGDER